MGVSFLWNEASLCWYLLLHLSLKLRGGCSLVCWAVSMCSSSHLRLVQIFETASHTYTEKWIGKVQSSLCPQWVFVYVSWVTCKYLKGTNIRADIIISPYELWVHDTLTLQLNKQNYWCVLPLDSLKASLQNEGIVYDYFIYDWNMI